MDTHHPGSCHLSSGQCSDSEPDGVSVEENATASGSGKRARRGGAKIFRDVRGNVIARRRDAAGRSAKPTPRELKGEKRRPRQLYYVDTEGVKRERPRDDNGRLIRLNRAGQPIRSGCNTHPANRSSAPSPARLPASKTGSSQARPDGSDTAPPTNGSSFSGSSIENRSPGRQLREKAVTIAAGRRRGRAEEGESTESLLPAAGEEMESPDRVMESYRTDPNGELIDSSSGGLSSSSARETTECMHSILSPRPPGKSPCNPRGKLHDQQTLG